MNDYFRYIGTMYLYYLLRYKLKSRFYGEHFDILVL